MLSKTLSKRTADVSARSIILRNAIAFAFLALVLATTEAWFRTPPPQAPWTEVERATLLSLWLGNLPPPPPPAPGNAVADDPLAQRLGHRLFFDVRLSANGQVSCATCHQPARRFTDGVVLAQGLAVGELNTMSLVGAAHSPWFFWDGRKDSLWSQALSPLESPIEQGIDRAAIARLIADDPMYRAGYEELFGSPPHSETPNAATETFVNVGKALEAYQRLLMSGETAFDRYVESIAANARMERTPIATGEFAYGPSLSAPGPVMPPSAGLSNELDGAVPSGPRAVARAGMFAASDNDAGPGLSRRQTEGLRLFIGKAQCLNCHNGPLLTNFEFHNTGVLPAPGRLPDKGRVAGIALALGDPFNCLGSHSDAGPGDCAELRFARTGADLIGARKTPSLRNLGGTEPFMHAGQLGTIAQVLDHYNRAKPAIVGHNEAKPLNLLPYELRRLEAFLETLDAPMDIAQRWLVPPPYPSTDA